LVTASRLMPPRSCERCDKDTCKNESLPENERQARDNPKLLRCPGPGPGRPDPVIIASRPLNAIWHQCASSVNCDSKFRPKIADLRNRSQTGFDQRTRSGENVAVDINLPRLITEFSATETNLCNKLTRTNTWIWDADCRAMSSGTVPQSGCHRYHQLGPWQKAIRVLTQRGSLRDWGRPFCVPNSWLRPVTTLKSLTNPANLCQPRTPRTCHRLTPTVNSLRLAARVRLARCCQYSNRASPPRLAHLENRAILCQPRTWFSGRIMAQHQDGHPDATVACFWTRWHSVPTSSLLNARGVSHAGQRSASWPLALRLPPADTDCQNPWEWPHCSAHGGSCLTNPANL
jgi:hypothetical protein